jgi:hypothetical protein
VDDRRQREAQLGEARERAAAGLAALDAADGHERVLDAALAVGVQRVRLDRHAEDLRAGARGIVIDQRDDLEAAGRADCLEQRARSERACPPAP